MSVLTTKLDDEHFASHATRHRVPALVVFMLCYGCMLLALLACSHLLG